MEIGSSFRVLLPKTLFTIWPLVLVFDGHYRLRIIIDASPTVCTVESANIVLLSCYARQSTPLTSIAVKVFHAIFDEQISFNLRRKLGNLECLLVVPHALIPSFRNSLNNGILEK